jgi:hypothetical protein
LFGFAGGHNFMFVREDTEPFPKLVYERLSIEKLMKVACLLSMPNNNFSRFSYCPGIYFQLQSKHVISVKTFSVTH